jgi:hypothetical protein
MTRRVGESRYWSYVKRVAAGVAAGGLVAGAVTLGTLIESDVGNDPRGQRVALNEFHEVLAGAEVAHGSSASTLASDLRARYDETGKGRDDARRVVEEFEYSYDGDDHFGGRYEDVSKVLGIEVFAYENDADCAECGRLEPSTGDGVVQALKGDLDGLVLEPASIELDRSWWAPTWVYAGLALAGSTLGWLLGRRREHRGWTRPLALADWALDGNATGAKVVNAALAPHLSGPVVVLASALHWGRAGVGRIAHAKEARAHKSRSGKGSPGQEQDADLAEARNVLAQLESLTPRTPGVAEAIEEVRNLVERLSAVSTDLDAVRVEAQASALVASVRGLEDSKSARLAAEREVARVTRGD